MPAAQERLRNHRYRQDRERHEPLPLELPQPIYRPVPPEEKKDEERDRVERGVWILEI